MILNKKDFKMNSIKPYSDIFYSNPQENVIFDNSNLTEISIDVKVLIVQKLFLHDGPKSTLALAKTSKYMHMLVHSKVRWGKRLLKRIKQAYIFALKNDINFDKTEAYLLSLVTFVRKGAKLSQENVIGLTDYAISKGLFNMILKIIQNSSIPLWFKNPMTLRATYHTVSNDNLSMTQTLLKTLSERKFQRGLLLISASKECSIEMAQTLLKDVIISPKYIFKAVISAFAHKNVILGKYLLQLAPISLSTVQKALIAAINKRDLEQANLLFSLGPLPQKIRENALIAASNLARESTNVSSLIGDSCFSQIFEILLHSGPISEDIRGILVINLSGRPPDYRGEPYQKGDKDLVKLLLNDGTISDDHRGRALVNAINSGYASQIDIPLMLIQSGFITDEHRGRAIIGVLAKDFPKCVRFDIFQMLLQSGPIFDEDRGYSCSLIRYDISLEDNLSVINKLIQSGYISDNHRGEACIRASLLPSDAVQILLQSGPISDEHRGKAIIEVVQWNRKKRMTNIYDYIHDFDIDDQVKTIRILFESGNVSSNHIRCAILESLNNYQIGRIKDRELYVKIVQELLQLGSILDEDREICIKEANKKNIQTI